MDEKILGGKLNILCTFNVSCMCLEIRWMDEKILGGKLNRALVYPKTKNFSRFSVTSNLVAHA